MRRQEPPIFRTEHVISALGNGARLNRVKKVADAVIAGEVEYLERAARLELSATDIHHSEITSQVESDIEHVYDSAMSNKKGSARTFYNLLRTVPYNKCLICVARDAGALDHYLPRERWPRLAIVPANLVAICDECNRLKGSKWGDTPETQYLHPYFDDLGTGAWLRAEVLEEPLAPLIWSVQRPSDWDDSTYEKVEKHFERFELAELYAQHSASLLASLRPRMIEIYQAGGAGSLKEDILGHARSFRISAVDYWSASAMQAWGESDWFCNGEWDTAFHEPVTPADSGAVA